jgi:hypothetical protein
MDFSSSVDSSEIEAFSYADESGAYVRENSCLQRALSGNSVPSFLLSASSAFSTASGVTHLMFHNCDTSGLDYRSTAFKVAVTFVGVGVVLVSIDLYLRYAEAKRLSAEAELSPRLVCGGTEARPLIDRYAPPCGPRLHDICKKYPNVIGTATGTVFGAGLFVSLLPLLLDSLCDLRKVAVGSTPMGIMAAAALISFVVLASSVFFQCTNRRLLASDQESELAQRVPDYTITYPKSEMEFRGENGSETPFDFAVHYIGSYFASDNEPSENNRQSIVPEYDEPGVVEDVIIAGDSLVDSLVVRDEVGQGQNTKRRKLSFNTMMEEMMAENDPTTPHNFSSSTTTTTTTTTSTTT